MTSKCIKLTIFHPLKGSKSQIYQYESLIAEFDNIDSERWKYDDKQFIYIDSNPLPETLTMLKQYLKHHYPDIKTLVEQVKDQER